MPRKPIPQPPEQIRDLLPLVEQGRIFKVQDWIQAGKPVRVESNKLRRFSPLWIAARGGFCDMVQIVLQAAPWGQWEVNEALRVAMKRPCLAVLELLFAQKPETSKLEFVDFCSTRELMRLAARSGVEVGNGKFCAALQSIKGKHLVGFFREMRAELPILEWEASTALAKFVEKGNLKWVQILRGAHVDSLKPAWDSDDEPPAVADRLDFSAVYQAMFKEDPAYLRALKCRLNSADALRVLDSAFDFAVCPEPTKQLLAGVTTEELNGGPKTSCALLLKMLRAKKDVFPWSDPTRHKIPCLQVLVDYGAKLMPDDYRRERAFAMTQSQYDRKKLLELVDRAGLGGASNRSGT